MECEDKRSQLKQSKNLAPSCGNRSPNSPVQALLWGLAGAWRSCALGSDRSCSPLVLGIPGLLELSPAFFVMRFPELLGSDPLCLPHFFLLFFHMPSPSPRWLLSLCAAVHVDETAPTPTTLSPQLQSARQQWAAGAKHSAEGALRPLRILA